MGIRSMRAARSLAMIAVALAASACVTTTAQIAAPPMPAYQARLATDIREASEPKSLSDIVFLIL